jgi:succinate dehydrogenase cytochrome b556 subunit
MAKKRSLGGFFGDLALNFNVEQLSFFLMRVTGIALVLYIALHIYTLSGILGGVPKFNDHLDAYNVAFGAKPKALPTLGFALIEWLLMVAVVYHLANGVRLILADLFELTRKQRAMLWSVGLATVVVCGASLFWFIPGL